MFHKRSALHAAQGPPLVIFDNVLRGLIGLRNHKVGERHALKGGGVLDEPFGINGEASINAIFRLGLASRGPPLDLSESQRITLQE